MVCSLVLPAKIRVDHARVVRNIGGSAFDKLPAKVHDQHALRDSEQERQDVLDEEDRHTLISEAQDHGLKIGDFLGGEPRRRLVQHQKFRLCDNRGRQH
jgi:hypothetical protein